MPYHTLPDLTLPYLTYSLTLQQSNDLLKHLPTAAFVAVDEEMTGISIPGSGRPLKDHSPSQRYPILKQAPERYSIIQLGVCLFHRPTPTTAATTTDTAADGTETNTLDWQVRRYNFYMFPAGETSFRKQEDSPREIVLNPGAVAFLNQHQMSFDLWMKDGVSYLQHDKAQSTVQDFIQTQRKALEQEQTETPAATIQETVRRRVELRRPQDIDFFARTMASLREWLDAAHPPDESGKSLLLSPCNSFLRRALYESIEKEYPSLDLESAGDQYPNQIRVWRLTPEEKVLRRKRLREEAWNNMICQKVGMWRVFEALSRVCRGQDLDPNSVLFSSCYDQINWDAPGKVLHAPSTPLGTGRKIPLVLHNGFMDMCFLLTHFHSNQLPERLPHCKSLIRSYFPIVYDTKIMSTECSTIWNNENSNLSSLFQKVVMDEGNGFIERLQVVKGDDSEEPVDQEHEAAYDAYMTGCVFVRLSNTIREQTHTSNPQQDDNNSNNNVEDGTLFGNLTHLRDDEQQARLLYGCNKFYQMSMYTLDLETAPTEEDPLSRGMSPDTTYRVGGIDTAVSTRDIVRCLSGLFDSSGRQVNYEIIWVDDTTFLVAASYRPPPPQPAEEGELVSLPSAAEIATVLEEHGRLVLEVLRGRFQNETIVTLTDFLKSVNRVEEQKPDTVFTRIMRFFSGEPPAPKRRRLN
jgi:poly(A)-specific ribonuclease